MRNISRTIYTEKIHKFKIMRYPIIQRSQNMKDKLAKSNENKHNAKIICHTLLA